MFKYNPAKFTIEDSERGLVVKQITGGGPSSFAGRMSSGNWSFDFLVSRESNRTRYVAGEFISNPDYSVGLHVTTYPIEGDFDGDTSQSDLAREAALALETDFYQSERARIRIN